MRDFYAFERHVATARASHGLEVPPEWYEQPVFDLSHLGAIYGPDAEVPYPEATDELDYEFEETSTILTCRPAWSPRPGA